MKYKKMGGLIAIIVGAIVIIIALYAKHRVNEAKGAVSTGSSLFGGNPVDKQITGAIEGKISEYDAPIAWTLIGGIVLVIAGICVMYVYRKKR